MSARRGRLAALLALAASAALALAPPLFADDPAASVLPQALRDVGIDQHVGAQLPLDLRFHDESGRQVRLGRLLRQEEAGRRGAGLLQLPDALPARPRRAGALAAHAHLRGADRLRARRLQHRPPRPAGRRAAQEGRRARHLRPRRRRRRLALPDRRRARDRRPHPRHRLPLQGRGRPVRARLDAGDGLATGQDRPLPLHHRAGAQGPAARPRRGLQRPARHRRRPGAALLLPLRRRHRPLHAAHHAPACASAPPSPCWRSAASSSTCCGRSAAAVSPRRQRASHGFGVPALPRSGLDDGRPGRRPLRLPGGDERLLLAAHRRLGGLLRRALPPALARRGGRQLPRQHGARGDLDDHPARHRALPLLLGGAGVLPAGRSRRPTRSSSPPPASSGCGASSTPTGSARSTPCTSPPGSRSAWR